MKRTALILALLCLPAPLAAAPHWAPLGPYGGSVDGLAVDPSDARIVYASREGGWFRDLSKSTDGGAHWNTILDSGGLVVVDPARHDTLYKADGQLLKSVDGGGSWAGIGPGPGSGSYRPYIDTVSVDPAQPSRIYAAGPTGVWRSTNRGASWRRASLSTGGGVVAVRPAGTVFVVGDGIHKSTDGGLTWQTLPLPNGVTGVWPFAVAPSDPRWIYAGFKPAGLYRSTDGGKTWKATGRQPEAGDTIDVLAVSSRSPRSLWLVTGHRGLYHSTDGGDTWKASGPSVRRHVVTVVIAPSSPGTVYAGAAAGIWRNGGPDPGGVFVSGDGGQTWLRSNRGLTGLEATAMAVDPQDPAVLWASNRIGLFRSTNGGLDWTQTPADGSLADRIVIDPNTPSNVFVLMGWSFLRTLDGGESWSSLQGPNGPRPPCGPGPGWCYGGMSYMGLGPEQPPKLWAGTDEGELFNSSDQGAHWNPVKLPQAPCYISDLDFAPSSPNILYAAGVQTQCDYIGHAAFFRSADGGATWKNAGAADLQTHPFQEGHRIAIDPVDPRLIYLGTWNVYTDWSGDGVWKSTDGGSTWVQAGSKLRGQPITGVVASPIAGVVWASTFPLSTVDGSRIFRSGDGGSTWQDRTANLDVGIVHQLAIDPVDPHRIYAVGPGGLWVWTP